MTQPARIHGFDALRAIAMLLGIVLHAIIPYMVQPVAGWPDDAALSSSLMDSVYHFIHSFRMELFFFVAGYFAHFSLTKNGTKKFIENRKDRVLIPFIVSILLILPLSYIPFRFYTLLVAQPTLSFTATLAISVKQSMRWNGLIHLWFLYYLLIFYVLLLLGRSVFKISFLSRFLTITGKYFLFLIIPAVSLALYSLPNLPVAVSTSLFPHPGLLLYYAIFFFWGFANFTTDFQLKEKNWSWLIYILIGLILQTFVFLHIPTLSSLTPIFLAIGTCLLVAGIVLCFLTFFTSKRSIIRYLADASYWMYLAHVPIVVSMQILLLDFLNEDYLAWSKPILIMLITVLITLLSYQYGVRYTKIGFYLHGKRNRH